MRRTKYFLLLLLTTVIASCGAEKLKDLQRLYTVNSEPVSVTANFCTIEASKVKSRLKFVYIIDKSGSNQDLGLELGTDPDGRRRYTALLSFLNGNSDDPTVFYSLINFSNDASTVRGFTNDRGGFNSLIVAESNPSSTTPPRPNDGGWTNYLSALGKAHELINNDIKAAKTLPEIISTSYVIFFITDGIPQVGTTQFQAKSDILNSIDTILALEKASKEYVDSIQVHTGFYYLSSPDVAAETLLQEMADRGNGDSYSFGGGQAIDFKQFAVPERNVKHALRDVIVSNVSTTWLHAELTLDTDNDGMPDDLEMRLGSDVGKIDSDGNGVSDGVEYRISGKPCKDESCVSANAAPYIECNAYELADKSRGRQFNDLDHDFLNDCEERILLKSKMDNFDSNEDWIPDDLAFRNDIAMIEGTQEANLDPDVDEKNNYSEVKIHSPPRYANDKIIGIRPYKYNLTTVSEGASETCFRLEVTNIAAIGLGNVMRVYIVENSAIIDGKRFMRVAEQKTSGTSVTFEQSDFK